MTVSHAIKQELALVCGLSPETIKDEAWLIEFGLDSIRSMELIIALEAHFDIEISNDDLAALTTVSNVVQLVEKYMISRSNFPETVVV